MEYLGLIAVFGMFAALVWAIRPRPAFIIRIHEGQASVSRGKVTPGFLAIVTDLCRDSSIQSGEIRGVAHGRRIALVFSNNLDCGFQQRVRNCWTESGWSAAR